MKRNYKRRTYFLTRSFQGKHVFLYFILSGLGIIFFTLLFFLFTADTLAIIYENGSLHLGKIPTILLNRILEAHWAYIVIGGCILVVITTLITHKVAGPLYRFEKSFDRMIDGDVSFHITLRNKDECKKLAEKFNRFNIVLCSKIRAMMGVVEQIDKILVSAEKSIESNGNLDQAIAMNRRLKKMLYEFNIEND
jgi:methyl-accepting chemotaxis protein